MMRLIALAVTLAGFAVGLAGAASQDTTMDPTGLDVYGYPRNETQAHERGRSEAGRDLTNGVVLLKFSGLPAPEFSNYARLMSARCGMTVQPIAGCLVTGGLQEYRRGYNEVSSSWIERRYGTNMFNDVWEQAREEYRKEMETNAKPAGSGPPPPKSTKRTYTVKAGDTFSKIARRTNVSLNALSKCNPGVNPRQLQIGQKLTLPQLAAP